MFKFYLTEDFLDKSAGLSVDSTCSAPPIIKNPRVQGAFKQRLPPSANPIFEPFLPLTDNIVILGVGALISPCAAVTITNDIRVYGSCIGQLRYTFEGSPTMQNQNQQMNSLNSNTIFACIVVELQYGHVQQEGSVKKPNLKQLELYFFHISSTI